MKSDLAASNNTHILSASLFFPLVNNSKALRAYNANDYVLQRFFTQQSKYNTFHTTK